MRQEFPEWPLAVFTTLAIMGAGVLSSPLADAPAARFRVALPVPLSWVGLALLAAGLVVSLAHLGQPHRAPLALVRVGRSRLSTEIALAGGTLVAGITAAALPFRSPAVMLLAALLAVSFLLALGQVYGLRGQRAWRGAAAFSPLTMGLAFGVLVLGAARDGTTLGVASIAVIVLAADAIVFLARWNRVVSLGGAHAAATAGASRRLSRQALLALRFALVDLVPVVLLAAHLPRGAAGSLGLGILIDRLAFYILAAPHTTESEIARIEEIISRSRPDA